MGLTMAQQRQAPSQYKEEPSDSVSYDLLLFLSHPFFFLSFLLFPLLFSRSSIFFPVPPLSFPSLFSHLPEVARLVTGSPLTQV